MTLISDDYISYAPYSSPQSVHLANKTSIDVIGEGTVKLFTIVNSTKQEVQLQHTLLVPTIANSLFSVKAINCLGYSVLFRPYGVFIKNPNEVIISKSEDGEPLLSMHH